ncbi:O-antigen ligase family protein [Endozoicomonadaceae bacterium StTr2]
MSHAKQILTENWSLWLLMLTMLLFVTVEHEKTAVNIFRIGICLPVLVFSVKHIIVLRYQDEFARLLSLFLLWGLLSLLWSPVENIKLFDNLIARTLTVFVVFYIAFHASKNELSRLWIEYAYLISAVILLINAEINRNSQDHGFGTFDSLNLVAWFISSAAIVSFNNLFFVKKTSYRLFFLILTAVYIFAIVEMGSRAAMLGFVTGFFSIFLYYFIFTDLKRLAVYCASLSFFIFFIVIFFDSSYVLWLIERGDSSRFVVYANAFDLITNTPASILFGHGLAADAVNFTEYKRVAHFHSIYLSTLFYTGVVGLSLFLLFVLRRPWFVFIKKNEATSWDFALIGGLVTFMFTGDKFISYPGGFFYALLLPLFFANAFGTKGRSIKK